MADDERIMSGRLFHRWCIRNRNGSKVIRIARGRSLGIRLDSGLIGRRSFSRSARSVMENLTDVQVRLRMGYMLWGYHLSREWLIWAETTEFFFEILFGTAKANATHCALNSRLAPPEIAYILHDCAVAIIFVDEQYREALELVRSQLPDLLHVVSLSSNGQNEYASWRDAQSSNDPLVTIEQEDIAYLLYTSGTTGKT